MATLTVNTIDRLGTIADFASLLVAAAGGGDAFPNDGATFLVVQNNDASSKTVTVAFLSTVTVDGQVPPNKQFTVSAGKTLIVGPWPQNFYSDTNGNVDLTYSAVTNVKVGAFNLTTQ